MLDLAGTSGLRPRNPQKSAQTRCELFYERVSRRMAHSSMASLVARRGGLLFDEARPLAADDVIETSGPDA